jgi:hypothetical protein
VPAGSKSERGRKAMSTEKDAILKVLAFWRAVEALSPQQISKEKPDDKNQPSYLVKGGNALLPWEKGHKHQEREEHQKTHWRYVVHCGLYDTQELVEKLVKHIDPKDKKKQNATEVTARLFDLHFDKYGQPIPDTLNLTLNAWASGIVLGCKDSGEKVLKTLEKEGSYNENSYVAEGCYNKLFELRKELIEYIEKNWEEFRRMGGSKECIDKLITHIAGKCQFPEELLGEEISMLVKSVRLSDKKNDESDFPFLSPQSEYQDNEVEVDIDSVPTSSFFINDLYKITKAGENNFGKALQSYFTKQTQKIDVRKDQKVWEKLRPENFPLGCWPSDYPLVFSQQLAINAMCEEFAEKREAHEEDTSTSALKEGLFAVNGPPGTGKTVLLRDIVAMVVVGRALKLSKLQEDGKRIFEEKINISNREFGYCPLKEELRDHSIVVASSNNSPVENISLELPRMASVSQERVRGHDYFRDIAARLLNGRKKDVPEQDSIKAAEETEEKAWGLISAALGKKENCQKFIRALCDSEAASSGLRQHLLSLKDGKAQPAIKLEEALEKFNDVLKAEKKLREKVKSTAENNPLHSQKEDDREKSSPFHSKEWFVERQNLFLAALDLHRAFIEAYPEEWLDLLQVVREWLEGKLSSEEQTCQHALDALCFIVPVISTTFASVGRMFSGIGKGGIGWLLVDEAGQAAPQQAVGAIWRARRVVVVGDPLQLEPIVTLPGELEKKLAETLGVEAEFRPSRSSVQHLADRASRWGTTIERLIKQKSKEKKENIWVSCPLRVHWRCSEPMFSIINEIAYGGLMIYGKVSTSCVLPDVLPEPAWIHVCGQKSKDHWIEEEGEALDKLLKELVKNKKVNPENIYLITPFRSVAEELKNKAKNYELDEKKVGTVHASQGKEADIVILVLGGNPKKPLAKSWSAQKPNLLNVAISRARERLYVIGDRSEWKNLKYFCVMAENLKEASFDSHGINWDESKPVQDSTGVSKPDTISTQQPRMHPQPSRQPQDGIKLPTLPRDVLPFISATCERLFL